jgi:hypothetical protein
MKTPVLIFLLVVSLLIIASPLALWLYMSEPPPVYAQNNINFTIIDTGGNGIVFASGIPGDPVQDSGTFTLVVGSDTEVDVDIYIRGTDLTGPGGTIAVTNVKYDDDATFGESSETDYEERTMANTYGTPWYSVPALTGDSREVFHQLTIPNLQLAGTYSGTFYYKAE